MSLLRINIEYLTHDRVLELMEEHYKNTTESKSQQVINYFISILREQKRVIKSEIPRTIYTFLFLISRNYDNSKAVFKNYPSDFFKMCALYPKTLVLDQFVREKLNISLKGTELNVSTESIGRTFVKYFHHSSNEKFYKPIIAELKLPKSNFIIGNVDKLVSLLLYLYLINFKYSTTAIDTYFRHITLLSNWVYWNFVQYVIDYPKINSKDYSKALLNNLVHILFARNFFDSILNSSSISEFNFSISVNNPILNSKSIIEYDLNFERLIVGDKFESNWLYSIVSKRKLTIEDLFLEGIFVQIQKKES